MDEMLYLDVLRKEHTKFYEKIPNIESYKVKCKCCGADAPYIGNVDFSKTCHDRFGDKVFKNTDCEVPYQKCLKCGFIFSTFADQKSLSLPSFSKTSNLSPNSFTSTFHSLPSFFPTLFS